MEAAFFSSRNLFSQDQATSMALASGLSMSLLIDLENVTGTWRYWADIPHSFSKANDAEPALNTCSARSISYFIHWHRQFPFRVIVRAKKHEAVLETVVGRFTLAKGMKGRAINQSVGMQFVIRGIRPTMGMIHSAVKLAILDNEYRRCAIAFGVAGGLVHFDGWMFCHVNSPSLCLPVVINTNGLAGAAFYQETDSVQVSVLYKWAKPPPKKPFMKNHEGLHLNFLGPNHLSQF
jgi:hypothetical protein